MTVYDKGLIIILICNTIISLLAIPLIRKKVPPNPLYGYRTRITMNDDARWYKSNVYFGWRLLVVNIFSAGVAVTLYGWQGFSPHVFLRMSILLLTAPVVIAWLLAARFVRQIGTEYRSSKTGQ